MKNPGTPWNPTPGQLIRQAERNEARVRKYGHRMEESLRLLLIEAAIDQRREAAEILAARNGES